ncbi:hypothetical protein ACFVZQ_36320, partial [Streptomyces sp. NPDC059538]
GPPVRRAQLIRLDSADPRGLVRMPGPARLGFGARSGGGPAGAGGAPGPELHRRPPGTGRGVRAARGGRPAPASTRPGAAPPAHP